MRRWIMLVVALVAVLSAAWAGWVALFEASPDAGVRIVQVRGQVDHIRPEGTGPAEVGQPVRPRDRLVAATDGTAVLDFGGDAQLTVQETTSIEVVSVDASGLRVELDGGRVTARVRAGGRGLAVGADGREVRATDADFTVVRAPDDTLAVEAERGEVSTNLPGAETIGAGNRVVAPRDRAALVAPAPDALLLEVAWPETTRTREAALDLSGTTEPGATVSIRTGTGLVTAGADPTGRWTASVPLTEGENQIQVSARGLLGQVAEVTWGVARDTTAPPIRLELRP